MEELIGQQAKLDELKQVLDAQRGSKDEVPSAPTPGAPPIDWDRYDLMPEIAHLYQRSEIIMEGDEVVILAPYNRTMCETKNYKQAGEYINDMVNGVGQWNLKAILPNGAGMLGLVFNRIDRVRLPNPELKPVEGEVPPITVTDEELANDQAAGKKWAEEGN